jgi:hypothetical protein
LSRKPVDLLVVEQGHIQRPPSSAAEQNWEALIAATPISKRPRVVIESWGSGADLWEKGPTTKGSQSRWSKLGYTSRCRRVNASHVGGAINQVRFLVARVQDAYAPLWSWKAYPSPPPPARPMGNLLTPPGLVRKSAYCQLEIDSPMDTLDPMPSYPGAWIKTERGHRRLLMEETARGLGVPKEWQLDSDKLSGGTLQRTTSLFHWEFLAASFLPSIARHTPIAVPATGDPTSTDTEVDSPRIPFDWRPPSLAEGDSWWLDRVAHAKAASQRFPNPEAVFAECLDILRIHRGNYNQDGPDPHQLQLIWWEFPPEHWLELREGCRMNFVSSPVPCVNPNAKMDEEQTMVAVEFIEELVNLGILRSNQTNSIEVL